MPWMEGISEMKFDFAWPDFLLLRTDNEEHNKLVHSCRLGSAS